MSSVPKTLLSPEEYLARERIADHKSEYFAGEVFAMAGASERHNLIVLNTAATLREQLRKRPCRVYPSDLRLKVQNTGLYTYPDVSVVCGEPELLSEQGDVLLNPNVLVEVLSESTEAYSVSNPRRTSGNATSKPGHRATTSGSIHTRASSGTSPAWARTYSSHMSARLSRR